MKDRKFNQQDDGEEKPSVCAMLMHRCATAVWKRGEDYVRTAKIEVKHLDDKEISALARGNAIYNVRLAFSGGGISKRCDCPYAKDSKAQHAPCKHMIAVAIIWDESRGLDRPSPQTVEQETIPPPKVSRAQINAVFDDPLSADLNILRIYVDESGRWSRPHAKLPLMPPFGTAVSIPLTLKEVKEAFAEIKRWSRRSQFDPYFCAGEMTAAFCDILRLVKKRLAATDADAGLDVLEAVVKFHHELLSRIDSSGGVHAFGEAHLRDLCAAFERSLPQDSARPQRSAKIRKLEEKIGDY